MICYFSLNREIRSCRFHHLRDQPPKIKSETVRIKGKFISLPPPTTIMFPSTKAKHYCHRCQKTSSSIHCKSQQKTEEGSHVIQ
mmetsp:Transcript_93468/g.190281  ORF Transcript_93468/g.190281 Transcript_93468/m.190281 type:complete len:84 (+) Transcript_93468:417-668(+)